MESNQTAHSQFIIIPYTERLDGLFRGFIAMPVFVASQIATIFGSIAHKRTQGLDENSPVFNMLFLASLVYLVYLVSSVNKSWAHYYLPIAVALPLSMIGMIPKRWRGFLVVGFVVLNSMSWFLYMGNSLISRSLDLKTKETHSEIADDIVRVVSSYNDGYSSSHYLVSAYTAFPFEQLGVGYSNVEIMWGPFRQDLLIDGKRDGDTTYDFIVVSSISGDVLDPYSRRPDYEEIAHEWGKLLSGDLDFDPLLTEGSLYVFKNSTIVIE